MAEKNLSEHLNKISKDIRRYIELKFDYLKAETVEKIVEVYSRIILWAILGMVFSFVFLFLLIALSLYLGKLWGAWYWGFLATSAGALIIALIILLMRHTLITNPLLRIFLSIFFNLDKNERQKNISKSKKS